jgi:hypothetical protein
MDIFKDIMAQFMDRYTLQLFKKNSNYIFATIFLILLNLYIFGFQFSNYYVQKGEIDNKIENLEKITSQRQIISKYDKKDVDKLYQVISLLVPNKEDYFSIISALENLSSRTGMEILSYSVNFGSSTSEKLVLKIEAKGDILSFKKFLEEYRFKGGRLITMDKIEYTNKDFRSTLDLNFYTRKVDLKVDEDVKAIDPATLTLFKEISNTLLRDNQEIENQYSLDDEYETKPNPFKM